MKIGIPTLLFCIFLTLKLCNVIDWSWWWVTSPLWIDFIFIVIFIIMKILALSLKESNSRREAELASSWRERMERMRKEREELINEQNKTK